MRKILFVAMLACGTASAQPHGDRERQEDAKRHRALALVHGAAAKCLESGKTEKDCLDKLRQDCKGLGIGKYCGLKHRH
ncbi:MAG TPA: hypothetical protein VG873_14865 [Burkholderiales bacterium]|nr:hypothetical protein [Burkholderiales bacterium]